MLAFGNQPSGSVHIQALSITADGRIGIACPGDFNCSGGISVQNVFDFLGAFFANDPQADINDAGGVSVQDVFDFLGFFFEGC